MTNGKFYQEPVNSTPEKNCECNGDPPVATYCSNCEDCKYLDCVCSCCVRRKVKIVGGVVVGIGLPIIIYCLATHPLPDFRKWHDYFSNLLGTRKLRFIPRSELDAPKITHITEEMDINPYSFFPSKDLM
ncbi:hypothetical protein BBBOND_0309440 [Babesia bigemina]|uniref:Uncharacterized protein n=1 Tax=Babesia bigemina TaxID=5866 RepID=A0A061D8K4_BABBI|nr:hypothetical protein BBBOND_0309440 [Babesia bigemina]CDR97041.1 hypothetical protein BBBOND_0309440 [Babesia bigemina]|eukprot:XP_012769227.1 hypothetical protein BBBOND_0309440 [Babesia bigemina]